MFSSCYDYREKKFVAIFCVAPFLTIQNTDVVDDRVMCLCHAAHVNGSSGRDDITSELN